MTGGIDWLRVRPVCVSEQLTKRRLNLLVLGGDLQAFRAWACGWNWHAFGLEKGGTVSSWEQTKTPQSHLSAGQGAEMSEGGNRAWCMVQGGGWRVDGRDKKRNCPVET